MFKITDGRPWYKQVITGILLTIVTLITLGTIVTLGVPLIIIILAVLANSDSILEFISTWWWTVPAVIVCGVGLAFLEEWASKE